MFPSCSAFPDIFSLSSIKLVPDTKNNIKDTTRMNPGAHLTKVVNSLFFNFLPPKYP